MAQSPIAHIRLLLNGQDLAQVDLSAKILPRLASLELTEELGEAADTLSFTLINHDGQLAPVAEGAVLTLEMGWLQGEGVTPGLISKGRFKVDSVEESGPPDVVAVKARSADLAGAYRKRKDKGHRATTVGAIVAQVARDNGLKSSVDPALAAIAVPAAEQAAKSDMAFVRDLGRRHDAIATVKDGTLIFMPIGAATTPTGKPLPSGILTKQSGWGWRFTAAAREENDGAEAQWQDKAQARRKTAKVGGTTNPKRIKRTFASEDEAKAAAKAEAARAKRGKYEFSYDLARGDPALGPNQRITLKGWNSRIDAIGWLVKKATHRFEPGGAGLLTSVDLISRG